MAMNKSDRDWQSSVDYDVFGPAADDYIGSLQDILFNERHKQPAFKYVIIILNSLIIIFGILGNLLVIFAILRSKKMRSTTYIFIGNLAVSDVTVCLLCLPFTLAASFQDSWNFGGFMCNFVPSVQILSVCVSTLTLTLIAVDRYYVVVRPLKARLSLRASLALIIAIWLVSACLASPIGFFSEIEIISIPRLFQVVKCSEQWRSTNEKGLYDIVMFLLQCVLPLLIIGISYARILLHMNRRVVPGVRTQNQQATDTRKKMKTTKMLVAVIVSFAVGWLPINIWILVSDFKFALVDNENMSLFYHIFHAIAMTTTCVNPFFYGLMNDAFREEYAGVFNSLAVCRRSRIARHSSPQHISGSINRTTQSENRTQSEV
ncbi:neuropeptide Y receptor type 2-like [Ptychodera flava]|uniref:neuropeptide Y receptor type 2-like n=1 Tax=Ptychodera flava TaxID=63121 RepID=UPI003969EE8C